MKKFFFTLIGLLAYLEIFAQLGYHYESKFIQLIPNTAEPYYVQTKSAESKEYLEKMTNTEIRQNNSNSEVYMISENSFFVSSMPNLLENITEGQARCEVLTEKVIVR